MKKTPALILSLAILALAAVPALAQKASAPSDDPARVRADVAALFKKLDVDKDGLISRDEYRAKNTFDRYDLDYDGFLSPHEMEQAHLHPQKRDERLNKQDVDGDGIISRNEFTGDDAAFARLDKNQDGVISDADKHVAKKSASGGVEARFKAMDLNGDGQLTRDEWRGTDRTFAAKDKDGDHFLTLDEVKGETKQ